MGSASPILLIGSASRDFIASYPGHFPPHFAPDKLSSLSVSFLVDNLRESYGGIAANIGYTLALLGRKSTILAAVGRDAKKYLRYLSSLGIDVSHVLVHPTLPTSTFFATTDLANRQICTFASGAMPATIKLDLSPWQGSDALVVVSAQDPQVSSQARRQRDQIWTQADLRSQPADDHCSRLRSHCWGQGGNHPHVQPIRTFPNYYSYRF